MPALAIRPLASVILPLRKFRSVARRSLTRIRDWQRGETDATLFDLFNPAILNPVLASHGVPALSLDPTQCQRDLAGAMRYILAHLALKPRWRNRYPQALSTGADGPFARAFLAHAREQGLSPQGLENLDQAFRQDPAQRVQRVFELREDLRGVFPLGLTPKQRGEYLGWLISSYGRKDFQLTPEAALWFHFQLDEDPSRGLAASYRLHPEWQAAVPHALTRFGWAAFLQFIRDRYQFDCRWLRKAQRPADERPWTELQYLFMAEPEHRATFPQTAALAGQAEPVLTWAKKTLGSRIDKAWCRKLDEDIRKGMPRQPGINVIGLFRYTSGLQQAVRNCIDSLDRAGVATVLRDYPVLFLREPRNTARYDALEPYDVTIINTGIDTPVCDAYRKSGLHPRPGVYRIGVWWWEMEELPRRWLDRGQEVDEIWAPTTFIAGAMRKAFPHLPVHAMLPGMELPSFTPLPRSSFGLRDDRFVFSFIFDMNSRMQRKNPLGLIQAFRKAFRPSDPVDLVIKVSPPESFYKDQWEELRQAVDKAGVQLIDRVLTRSEVLALLQVSDAYVSLHRSEGFGLTCAEAMLLGKPVIATGYSANLDFMTQENSYLVRYQRVMLEEDIDPYPRGAYWADPDIDHAAECMRQVVDQPELTRHRAARGAREVRELLSLKAAGVRMAQRLAEIQARKR